MACSRDLGQHHTAEQTHDMRKFHNTYRIPSVLIRSQLDTFNKTHVMAMKN